MHFLNAGFRPLMNIGLFHHAPLLTQLSVEIQLFLISTFAINMTDEALYLLWSYRILFSCQPAYGLRCKIIAHNQ